MMRLFEPMQIRGMTLKNRIMMLSMGIPGQVGDIAVDYFVARAGCLLPKTDSKKVWGCGCGGLS